MNKKEKKIVEDLSNENDSLYKENKRLKTSRFRIGIILWIVGCVILTGLFYNLNEKYNISESDFCLEKLNTFFPEYEFYEASYYGDNYVEDWRYTCKGYYYEEEKKPITRDGLKEVNEREKKEKRFELTNRYDIDYLESDDWTWMVIIGSIISAVMGICGIAFAIEEWYD